MPLRIKPAPPSKSPTHFTPEALKFLRNLRRNNDREWFTPRKPIFDAELRAPMLALIAQINQAMTTFAPDHIRPPEKIIMRLYRDTRFSANKTPYKSHVSAWWAHSSMPKTSGAGYYLHLAAAELTLAAGVFMPPPEQLLAIRRHLLTHHADLSRLLAAKKLKMAMPDSESASLKRPPKGFPADHPGIDLIRGTRWGASVTLPAEAALKPTLLAEIVKRFRLAAPIVDLLNEPITGTAKRRPLFALE
jgi:uncharacterized protein (TIGR02453 family)